MSDLGKLGGDSKVSTLDDDKVVSQVSDTQSELIRDLLVSILEEQKLTNFLLKGILQ